MNWIRSFILQGFYLPAVCPSFALGQIEGKQNVHPKDEEVAIGVDIGELASVCVYRPPFPRLGFEPGTLWAHF